ncbi:MAG: DUF882 domain-containing protein, partial [Dongiaceae bacterium]
MTLARVSLPRRSFFIFAAGAACALVVKPDTSSAATASTRTLALHSQASNELFVGPYLENGRYLPSALSEIDHLFRDRHNNHVHRIDVKLLDVLYTLRQHTNYQGAVEILCGYRSQSTNKMLRKKNKLVAKDSLHIHGKAVDIRLFDEPLDAAYKAALELRAGGVGYYRKQGFLHLDVGPVRT